ncbi:hypothetical protein LTS15_001298 [Exophiala xenobiotica]|nr:hypothetical protein LTS15_001298 [Exophiala xenobiotica]
MDDNLFILMLIFWSCCTRGVFAAPAPAPAPSPQLLVPLAASDIISAIVSTEPPLSIQTSLPPLPPWTPTSEIVGTVSIETSMPPRPVPTSDSSSTGSKTGTWLTIETSVPPPPVPATLDPSLEPTSTGSNAEPGVSMQTSMPPLTPTEPSVSALATTRSSS